MKKPETENMTKKRIVMIPIIRNLRELPTLRSHAINLAKVDLPSLILTIY